MISLADPPDISYEQPQFYADRVREELLDWNDKFGLWSFIHFIMIRSKEI